MRRFKFFDKTSAFGLRFLITTEKAWSGLDSWNQRRRSAHKLALFFCPFYGELRRDTLWCAGSFGRLVQPCSVRHQPIDWLVMCNSVSKPDESARDETPLWRRSLGPLKGLWMGQGPPFTLRPFIFASGFRAKTDRGG